jgi:hypothetical protein
MIPCPYSPHLQTCPLDLAVLLASKNSWELKVGDWFCSAIETGLLQPLQEIALCSLRSTLSFKPNSFDLTITALDATLKQVQAIARKLNPKASIGLDRVLQILPAEFVRVHWTPAFVSLELPASNRRRMDEPRKAFEWLRKQV